jgi:hypothetical protein
MTDHDNMERATESTPNIALLNAAEVDQQVATAHRYPRSIKQFVAEARTLVTMTEEVAESCTYALPRKQKDKDTGQWVTKNIEGPSARFAEIVLSCWGNARAGTRIVDEGAEFVTAQGFMFDLQKNVAIQIEVPRRITDSQGRRYKTDMIGVTANAAASIALRNAILKVIPKALWEPLWQEAKKTALGDEATLSNKRTTALAWFQKKGASAETIYEHLGVKGIEDITLEHIATLQGYKTALRDGDTTVEQLFSKDDPAATGKQSVSLDDIRSRAADKPAAQPATDLAGTPLPASGNPAAPEPDALLEKLKKAKTLDALDTHAAWISPEAYPDEAVRLRLSDAYEARRAELTK